MSKAKFDGGPEELTCFHEPGQTMAEVCASELATKVRSTPSKRYEIRGFKICMESVLSVRSDLPLNRELEAALARGIRDCLFLTIRLSAQPVAFGRAPRGGGLKRGARRLPLSYRGYCEEW